MNTFNNYELPTAVLDLSDRLIADIAHEVKVPLSSEPTVEELEAIIGKVGPDRDLQKNIGIVKDIHGDDTVSHIAGWIDRSGIMLPVERAFADNTEVPESVDTALIAGGVANWMLRRTVVAESYAGRVSNVVFNAGPVEMAPGQNKLVGWLEKDLDRKVTQADFAAKILVPRLGIVKMSANAPTNDGGTGQAINEAFFKANPDVLEGTILSVTNAPNQIQATAEILLAARKIDPQFNSGGDQLFMVSDTFPLALNGEKPASHQNPLTALGQLARNALYLQRVQQG